MVHHMLFGRYSEIPDTSEFFFEFKMDEKRKRKEKPKAKHIKLSLSPCLKEPLLEFVIRCVQVEKDTSVCKIRINDDDDTTDIHAPAHSPIYRLQTR